MAYKIRSRQNLFRELIQYMSTRPLPPPTSRLELWAAVTAFFFLSFFFYHVAFLYRDGIVGSHEVSRFVWLIGSYYISSVSKFTSCVDERWGVLDGPRGRYWVRQVLLQKSCVLKRLWQEYRCCVGVTATLVVAGLKIFETTMNSTSREAIAILGDLQPGARFREEKHIHPHSFCCCCFFQVTMVVQAAVQVNT